MPITADTSQEFETALTAVRSHLVQVLLPSDSPRTTRHKKKLAALAKKKLYELVQMLEDSDEEEEEEDEEEPEHIERFNGLVEELKDNAQQTSFMTARMFHLCMSRPIESGAGAEHNGLLRLLFGYADKPRNWATALKTPLEYLQDWDSWCQQSQTNDREQNFGDQLDFLPKMTYSFTNESDAASFVHYVLRMIETLKFIERWNTREKQDGHRARSWKIQHIETAFKYSSSENRDLWQRLHHLPKKIAARQPLNKAMRKHSSEHARMITSRNTFYDLYKLFGPGVFLDRLWDPQNPRSKSFRALLDHLKSNMPTVIYNNRNIPVNITRFSWGADSLFNILTNLTNEAVALHAQNYMQEHEPTGEKKRSWGRKV